MSINIDPGDIRTYAFDTFKVDPSVTNSSNRWPADPLYTVAWANTIWSTLIEQGSYTYSNEDIGAGPQGANGAFGTSIRTPGVAIRFCDHDTIATSLYNGVVHDGVAQTSEPYTLDKS
jgi:hypothetical protein